MVIESNSGFVGAMAAGFAAGVITNELNQFVRHMPKYIRQAAHLIMFPVFSLLLMKFLSVFVITPVAAAVGGIFRSLLESAAGTGDVWGGTLAAAMMAIDMGGIINKVAYNYGVESIADGGTLIMAAVMAGGMVPPVGIFFSMLFFGDAFTEAEKERSSATLVMGLSFITEGALPYVFTDIFRVIPSCVAGSAVAGMLSALCGCSLPAPHGGVFVFPVTAHPLLYAMSVLAGSVTTAVILGLLKRRNMHDELSDAP